MGPMRVLILGGSGVFGSRLARMLLADGHAVVVAGRRAHALDGLVAAGAEALVLDRAHADWSAILPGVDIVVDAAGPFQAYGSAPLAEAAIAAGVHYLDLSDDAPFSSGISRLDEAARAAGVVVLSGVSSVPALSSAIAADLSSDLGERHLVESVILPGNRAPRGLSVIRAILAQAGRPVPWWRAGRLDAVPGWGRLQRLHVPGLGRRWSSAIGAPDLALFPEHFGARSVRFRAGLELSVLHLGLWALSWLPRLGLVRSLTAAAPALRWFARLARPFGSDRGGMQVTVVGDCGGGQTICRVWTLVVGAGDGPNIPALPGRIMVRKLAEGGVTPGARPCLAEFTRIEAETGLASLETQMSVSEMPVVAMFETALGAALLSLPVPVQDLHRVLVARRWAGEARVDRGPHPLARLICALVGFPPASDAVPVVVTMERRGETEVWVRDFGGRRFRSVLRVDGPPDAGLVRERFGPLSFRIKLSPEAGRLRYPVQRGYAFGMPLPRWLLPTSQTFEAAEGDTATFDVGISLPVVGLLVRYRGWLRSD